MMQQKITNEITRHFHVTSNVATYFALVFRKGLLINSLKKAAASPRMSKADAYLMSGILFARLILMFQDYTVVQGLVYTFSKSYCGRPL